MSNAKIRWEPYGSMHFGYLGDSHDFSYIVQGPDKGMYTLYSAGGLNKYVPIPPIRIGEFKDVEAAKLAAERMEASKCQRV